jgi:hypothetical protein
MLLYAIDGEKLDKEKTPLRALINKRGVEVQLTVSDEDGSNKRNVWVKTSVNEREMRYRDWVERNRKYVHEKTDGRVGYIYIPDMGAKGYSEFHRYFFSEFDNCDLRSNDEIQKQLEIGMKDLGYVYKRQREEGGGGSSVITSSIVAESVLAIWREKPQQAKFRRKEHFGKLYETIFKELNAAQAILAVMIFRFVENVRKRPTMDNPPDFLPYASHYLAMLIGRRLLADQQTKVADISHKNFHELMELFNERKKGYHKTGIKLITNALHKCYGDRDISLQQLSATFRRGDLLEMLN